MKSKQSFSVAAASTTGFASNVTGASWVLTAITPNDGLAHFVTVHNDSVTDHSGKTIVLTGYDANGNAQTETIAAPGTSATVTSTKAFKSLTSAVPSATIGADTFDIGWTAAAVSPWVPLKPQKAQFSASFAVIKSGTINYDVQHTYDETLSGVVAFNHATVTAKTANADGIYVAPVEAVRVNINSHTLGTFDFYVLQGEQV